MARRTIDRLLADAAERILRLEPSEAFAAASAGALLIDIRARDARERNGVIPGALHLPRTVLEWRVDSDSAWRNPAVGGIEQQLILVCDQGYASVLAAAALVQLGFARAGDVIGGFEAWVAAGLPVVPAPAPPPGLLPGMGPPD
jgi:rhodanese-related sulfurtransferase